MFKQTLIATALVAGVGTAASAASVTYTADLADQRTKFTDVAISVQQFDSALGTLDSIQISLEGRVSGGARYESDDAAPGNITLNLSAMVSVSTDALGELVVTLPTATKTVMVEASDGRWTSWAHLAVRL